MNLYEISGEAFFGLDNPFRIKSIKFVNELRTALKSNDLENDNIRNLVEDYCKIAAEHFNVEKITLGLERTEDAFAYFTFFNSEIFGNSKTIDEGIKALENIEITKTGYRFKRSKYIKFIIGIGTNILLNDKFTDEQICGILFHEFGHCFQQSYISIRAIVASMYNAKQSNEILSTHKRLADAITKSGVDEETSEQMANKIAYRSILDNDISNEELMSLYDNINDHDDGLLNLDTLSLETQELDVEDIDRSIKRILEDKEDKDFEKYLDNTKDKETLKKIILRNKYLKSFAYKVKGIFNFLITNSLIDTLLIPSSFISDLFIVIHRLETNKNRSAHLYVELGRDLEQFADNFAISYGFGDSLIGGLGILIKNDDNSLQDNSLGGILVRYTPIGIMNLIVDLSIESLFIPYSNDYERFANAYRYLENELKTNKDLTKEEKKAIEAQMVEIKKVFDKMNRSLSPKRFYRTIFRFIMRKNIKNSSNDIIEKAIEDEERRSNNSSKDTKVDPKDLDNNLKVNSFVKIFEFSGKKFTSFIKNYMKRAINK